MFLWHPRGPLPAPECGQAPLRQGSRSALHGLDALHLAGSCSLPLSQSVPQVLPYLAGRPARGALKLPPSRAARTPLKLVVPPAWLGRYTHRPTAPASARRMMRQASTFWPAEQRPRISISTPPLTMTTLSVGCVCAVCREEAAGSRAGNGRCSAREHEGGLAQAMAAKWVGQPAGVKWHASNCTPRRRVTNKSLPTPPR